MAVRNQHVARASRPPPQGSRANREQGQRGRAETLKAIYYEGKMPAPLLRFTLSAAPTLRFAGAWPV